MPKNLERAKAEETFVVESMEVECCNSMLDQQFPRDFLS
jgi:hypothetical protein